LAEFLFEESVPPGKLPGEGPEEMLVPFPVLVHGSLAGEALPQVPGAGNPPEIPEEEFPAYTGEPESDDDLLSETATGARKVSTVPGGGKDGTAARPFSETVLAAISSLPSANDRKDPAAIYAGPVAGEPVPRPVAPPVVEEVPAEHADMQSPDGRPGLVPAPRTGPPSPHAASTAKRSLTAASVAVLAILVLVAGISLMVLHAPDVRESGSGAVVTPAITVSPTTVPVLKNTPSEGIRIRVIYPGTYLGTVGNPGFMHPVSGSGDQSYTVLKNGDLVSADIRKQDNSGSALTVEIYNNGTLITSRTVTAPGGEIALLINPETGSPPGVTIAPANATSAATLAYY
jgi:hypothetical protein